MVTANVAAFFIEQDSDEEIGRLEADLASLHAKIDRLLDTAAATSVGDTAEPVPVAEHAPLADATAY